MNKLFWIMLGAAIGYFFNVLTPLTLSWFQDTSSKIIVRQFYNTVEKKRPVPERVGGLTLDYQIGADRLESVYWVEVANEGKGPESDLRMQVLFPENFQPTYFKQPEVKIYNPTEVSLDGGKFYIGLAHFPKNAMASVAFEFKADKTKLCDVEIKVAGQKEEGKVEGIKGIQCGH